MTVTRVPLITAIPKRESRTYATTVTRAIGIVAIAPFVPPDIQVPVGAQWAQQPTVTRPAPDAGAPTYEAEYLVTVAKDRPNPTRIRDVQQPQNPVNLLTSTLDKKLVAESDWDNPVYGKPQTQEFWSTNLAIFLAPEAPAETVGVRRAATFAPLPQRRPTQQPEPYFNATLYEEYVAATVDWETWMPPRYVQQPEQVPAFIIRLPLPPVPETLALAKDYPNPIPIQYPVQPEQVGKPWNLAEPFPARQRDWPNPVRKIYVTQIERRPPRASVIFTPTFPPTILMAGKDFPNPIPIRYPVQPLNRANQTVLIIPAVPLVPSVTLVASDYSIPAGTAVTLTWTSANVTNLAAAGGWVGAKPLSGSQSSGILNSTTTFSLTGSGVWGNAYDSVTITIEAAPPGTGIEATPAGRVILRPKRESDTDTARFDFISHIARGDSISSATTSISVYSGVDADVSDMLLGVPTIRGTLVTQKVCSGTPGVTYNLACRVVLASGNILIMTAYLSVIPDRKS